MRCNPARSLLPEVDVQEETVSGRDGSVLTQVTLKPLDIDVQVRLLGDARDDLAALRRTLAPLLWRTGLQEVVFPDEPDKRYYGVLKGTSALNAPLANSSTTLTLHIPDPVAYGEERGETVTTGGTTIEVGGDHETWPRVTATPRAGISNWRLTNSTTGEFVEVEDEFDGSSELVIDMGTANDPGSVDDPVRVAGRTVAVTTASTFFALQPGTNTLTSTTACRVAWSERWVG